MAEPRRGYSYAQAVGTDTPVFWDVQFRFTQTEAVAFQLWFINKINRGLDEFTLQIRTEFGLVTHTCRFLPDSLLDASEDGQTWVYTARIMARAQVIPDDYAAAAGLIVALADFGDWGEMAGILDQAINSEWPA